MPRLASVRAQVPLFGGCPKSLPGLLAHAAAQTPREKRREEAEKRREESRRDKAAAAEAFALRSYATPKLAARAAGWRT